LRHKTKTSTKRDEHIVSMKTQDMTNMNTITLNLKCILYVFNTKCIM